MKVTLFFSIFTFIVKSILDMQNILVIYKCKAKEDDSEIIPLVYQSIEKEIEQV